LLIRLDGGRGEDNGGKLAELCLRFDPCEEIKARPVGHFEIGNQQGREWIPNAIGINACALKVVDGMLSIGNMSDKIWHACLLESSPKKESIILVIFRQQNCVRCAHIHISCVNDSSVSNEFVFSIRSPKIVPHSQFATTRERADRNGPNY